MEQGCLMKTKVPNGMHLHVLERELSLGGQKYCCVVS